MDFVDTFVRMDVAPSKVAKEVNLKFNKYVLAKDIENRRQK